VWCTSKCLLPSAPAFYKREVPLWSLRAPELLDCNTSQLEEAPMPRTTTAVSPLTCTDVGPVGGVAERRAAMWRGALPGAPRHLPAGQKQPRGPPPDPHRPPASPAHQPVTCKHSNSQYCTSPCHPSSGPGTSPLAGTSTHALHCHTPWHASKGPHRRARHSPPAAHPSTQAGRRGSSAGRETPRPFNAPPP
jgi:hypothetical protein